jgi:anhydro-N-acetylmuramic acid kinase
MSTDPIAALLALRQRAERRIVGLNSGTSADGVDAVVARIFGAGDATRVTVEAFVTLPYLEPLRARLIAGPASAAEVAALDVAVGAAFADAAEAALAAAGGGPCDLVASHGQTISHLPRSAGGPGATLQIGQPAILAERLGAPVVSDFRVRDVAAGGEGAPLVPLADFILFGRAGAVRAVQNIGGIANLAVVGDRLDDVYAFDTGPGNMPLDLAARALFGESYDPGGAHAALGRVDDSVVAELLADPYFEIAPPRSTGRERYGEAFLARILPRFAGRPDDLLATLTRFVAASIHAAYARWVLPRSPVAEILVSGGGVHNQTLMRSLAELLAPIPVRTTAALGVDPDAKEAVAFAILANETLHGRAGNLPAATGARGPRVLGVITP